MAKSSPTKPLRANTSSYRSIITGVPSSWMRKKKYTREISVHLPWRIISTKPFFPKSCRSRTLDALVVPNTPTLWIKTPPPLTQHGATRVHKIQSSLNKRQPRYKMYLNGHLPRSGKLLRVQLLVLPAVGHKGKSQHLVLDLFLLLFTWPLYPAC